MTIDKVLPALLSIDDDADIGGIIKTVATQAGFAASAVSSPEQFYQQLSVSRPDVVVLDLQMPGADGVELLRRLADEGARCSIVLVSGVDRRTLASAEAYAKRRGLRVVATIGKPFLPEDLLRTFLSIIELTRPLGVEDFEKALQNDQLLVVYQPVAHRSGAGWSMRSVEALVRWEHPERGTLFPRDFLQLGKESTLGRDMTDFVIRTALEQLLVWSAELPRVGLRINVAANLISDVDFPDRLELALNEFNVQPQRLTIEINETAVLGSDASLLDILTRLRVKGVGLSIDDFGVGYSSLTQLFEMPFSEMKIDGDLVRQISDSKPSRLSVKALIELAHNLGLTVCAESVEDASAFEFLDEDGCDAAQGFFLSPPVRGARVVDIVREWSSTLRPTLGLEVQSG